VMYVLEPKMQYALGDLITRARKVPRAVALMGALSDAHSRLLPHVYGTGNGEGRAAVNHTMAVTRSAIRANYHTQHRVLPTITVHLPRGWGERELPM
jgi:hypothetical protein